MYEFMHNGSLEEWLHPVSGADKTVEAPKRLNFLQRINIAIDVACALKYLHHDCQPATAHCDLKPSNVLLDHEMTAHVADFGLAKLLPPAHLQTSSIGVKGTIGYIAPGIIFSIYHSMTSKVTQKLVSSNDACAVTLQTNFSNIFTFALIYFVKPYILSCNLFE